MSDHPVPATITVRRNSPDDIGVREIFLSLDGQELGILQSGDSLTRDVPPGPHELRAHNTLFRKKLLLDLHAGEHAEFLAINKAGTGTFSIFALFGAGPVYLTVERVPTGAPPRR